MTTAHRPTWAPAKGHEEQGGARWYVASRMASAKNLPSQLRMKYRKTGQAAPEEVAERDLRADLESKEREHFSKGVDFAEERKKDLELLEQSAPSTAEATAAGKGGGGGGQQPRALIPKAVDADEEDVSSGPGDNDSDDDDDDDEDEEAALMAELDRIKKERAEEARKKAAEEEARQAKEKEAELMTGNPLLALGSEVNFSIKRRWDEDVVFKNQARNEPKAQKRFINDTIRNDFHKRFLTRYIR